MTLDWSTTGIHPGVAAFCGEISRLQATPHHSVLHLGVSGTRRSPWLRGAQALTEIAEKLSQEASTRRHVQLHHGCCRGWDAVCHYTWLNFGMPITCHPPTDNKHRSELRGGLHENVFWKAPQPYLVRDQAIVDDADILLAHPRYEESHEASVRSGTWATVRMARKKQIPVWFVAQDGRVHVDDGGGAPASTAHPHPRQGGPQ